MNSAIFTAPNPPLDSKEGMQMLASWARGHGAVLAEWHERLAAKHGVSLDGIVIARRIPIEGKARIRI